MTGSPNHNTPPTEGGHAAALIRQIQSGAQSLDPDRLNVISLTALAETLQGLVDIAKAQNEKYQAIENHQSQIAEWRSRHDDDIANIPAIQDALVAIVKQIQAGTMSSENIDTVLGFAEEFISTEKRRNVVRDDALKALNEGRSLKQAADSLDSLGIQLTELEAAIYDCLGCPSLKSWNETEPDQTVDAASEPETNSEEAAHSASYEYANDGSASSESDEKATTAGLNEISTLSTLEDDEDVAGDANADGINKEYETADTTSRRPKADSGSNISDDPVSRPFNNDLSGNEVDEGHDMQSVRDLDIAMAINCSHFGVAYHMALSMPHALLSADLIKLVACNYVTDELSPVGAELPSIAHSLLADADHLADVQGVKVGARDFAVLGACAALHPALVAPGGPVAQLLTVLEPKLGDMPSLRSLANKASEVSMTGVDLPRSLLYDDATVEKWREKEASLRIETNSWISSEQKSKIRFHAATMVWRRLLEEWVTDAGLCSLGHLFGLLALPSESVDADEVGRVVEYWRTNRDREIDRIDRDLRGSTALKKIEGSARTALRNKVDQALAFADRWLSLIGEQPEQQSQFHTGQANKLRATRTKHLELATQEVADTAVGGGAVALLTRYGSLFERKELEQTSQPVSLRELLHADLLADPDIAFDDTGRPIEAPLPPSTLRRLLEDAPSLSSAAVIRAERGDFIGADAAIGFAEHTGRVNEDEVDSCSNAIEEHRARLRAALKDQLKKTHVRLDAAYAGGTLTLQVYESQIDQISNLESDEGPYAGQSEILVNINDAIRSAENNRLNAIRRTLKDLKPSPDVQRRIDSVVDEGQFQIAEDFLERLERRDDLPDVETHRERPLDSFFPRFVEGFSEFASRDQDGIAQIRQAVETQQSEELVDTSSLSREATLSGTALLDAWEALRNGPTSRRLLLPLMDALGFNGVNIAGSSKKTSTGQTVFSLSVQPIVDREVVCLPDFGSLANGKYKLFTVRGRTTSEAVFREADRRQANGSPPSILVFVGLLDVESRQTLAQDFGAGEHNATLVLDEALIAFLAAWPGNRLAAFFNCASAFAYSQPYDPDAPELAPEMFYGRAAARAAIIAMSGDLSHFVYGGRRLGKTTLLADIAREYRAKAESEPKQLVLLVNLKGSGIGENRRTEDLWPLFARRLADHKVLQPNTVRPNSIAKGVKEWLQETPGRRILMLVDEADDFFEAERRPEQGYRVLEGIKVLMEDTARSFKVVFAGLHDVQRAAKDPNTPFAHLGEAVQIGPMLPEIDGDEIQKLIRGPLEALGYRFVSNDSIIRIAAETNYYPALAQQFCKELLRTMREAANTSDEQGPPFPIHPDTVDSVFNARETRNRVRNLFRWTIQLDPRYEFLTYLIAQRSFDNELGRPLAMPIADIREAALREWNDGFARDPSYWMFEVLLDEMVGLGILREVSNRCYAIRTRNLRMLLGNDEEIARRFADACRRGPPPVFDPPQFRSTLDNQAPSSLSASQEELLFSGLNAVGFVFGTRLSGLERVCESIQKAAERPDGSLLFSGNLTRAPTLLTTLKRVSKGRKPGTEVVLVDMRDGWDENAVQQALSFVHGREGQTRVVRPVFVCGPNVAWYRLFDRSPAPSRAEIRDVWLGPCGRDFTRMWLTARESRAYLSLETPGNTVDLPWPVTLESAVRHKQLKSIDEVNETTLNNQFEYDCQDILISEDLKVAFRLLSELAGDPVTADELSGFVQDEGGTMSPEDVVRFFAWADRLGIVYGIGGSYRLDTTYAIGLSRAFAA